MSLLPPPNFLLVHADQHRFDCVGINGHPLLRTPHLDRLARDGLNFTHAFTPIPLCTPARNCLLHGCLTSEHRNIANFDTEAPQPPLAGLPSHSQLLRDSGYRTAYFGKWHAYEHRNPTHFGYDRWVDESAYTAWRAARGLPPRPETLRTDTARWYGASDVGVRPEESRLAWGADLVLDELRAAAAETGRPFYIRWDPSEPHLPCVVPPPYDTMYPAEAIEPWPSFPDSLAGKPYVQHQVKRTWQVDGWTWQRWQPVVQRMLGEVSLLDAQIGRILDTLDALGLAENTLVVYTADHGDLCGAHGMLDKHFVMYDDVVRVPLIARWPRRIAPGSRCDAFIEHETALARTFLQAAGVSVPETFTGDSLLPIFDGHPGPDREHVFSVYHGNIFGLWTQRMVRGRRWKYIWNAAGEDECYDLATDPGEIHNRIADPAAAGEIRRLREALVAWMESVRDPILNQWTRPQLLEPRK